MLVLFEVDPETHESTGIVAPFCCENCRKLARRAFGMSFIDGVADNSDFQFDPQCENCGSTIPLRTSMKTIYFIIACLLSLALLAFAIASPVFAAGGGHAAPSHASKAANDHDADD